MISITSNIDQVIERFKRKADQAGNVDVTPALTAGVNAARGAMTNRIFNKGLDNQGASLGKYVGKKKKLSKAKDEFLFKKRKRDFFTLEPTSEFSEYELIRIGHGRQVRYKDEELTGTLKRGIVTITENEKRVVCAIPNNKLFLIAQGQEKQVGKIQGGGQASIFSLSEQERQVLKDTTNGVLKQIYDSIINT
jgi:hypothetical protein